MVLFLVDFDAPCLRLRTAVKPHNHYWTGHLIFYDTDNIILHYWRWHIFFGAVLGFWIQMDVRVKKKQHTFHDFITLHISFIFFIFFSYGYNRQSLKCCTDAVDPSGPCFVAPRPSAAIAAVLTYNWQRPHTTHYIEHRCDSFL